MIEWNKMFDFEKSRQRINHFLQPKRNQILGMDIGTRCLKLAESEKSAPGPVIKTVAIADIPPGIIEDDRILNMDKMVEFTRRQLSTNYFSSKNVVMAVGGTSLFAREVVFPTMSMQELQEAVKWDLERYVPFPPDSYYYDFAYVGQKSELECKVLLVAAPKDIINERIQLIKALDLQLMAIDIEPLALYRLLPQADGNIIIDIGAANTQISVFQQQSLLMTRSFSVGGNRFTEIIKDLLSLDLHEAEQLKQRQQGLLNNSNIQAEITSLSRQLELTVDELVHEIRQTLDFYQLHNRSAVISKAYLAGGGAKLDNLAVLLQRKLGIDILPYTLDNSEIYAPALDANYIRKFSQELGIAVGLSLYGGEP